jgi:hypothetical protein
VWNRKENSWEPDENLRLECFDPDTDCCDRIRIRSDQGSASFYHPRAMGSYLFWTAKNGRTVYKHESQDLYFYYNDWGNLKVSQRINFTQPRIDKQVHQELIECILIQQIVVLLITSQDKIFRICLVDVSLMSLLFDLILMS